MRILYVTACMPYGVAETFIIGEIAELLRANEVLIVPRSPGAMGPHAVWLAPHTKREPLLSWRVMADAAVVFLRMPRRSAASLRSLLRSGSIMNFLRNLAVIPKGLWLAKVATDWQADHMHCHWAGTTATMAMIGSTISGIPWSLTAHRSDIVSNNLLREKARSATIVRAIANEGRRMLIARGVEDNDKVRVLPMGVPIPNEASVHAPCGKVVLCAADLLEVKGHRFLIEALKILRERGIEAKLWLAGSGELEPKLREQVARLDLGDMVKFLGTIRHDDLLDLYGGGIAAAVLASVDLGGGCHEGIPVALVEAMSYGVPVVATSTGGIPELVQPGTGLLVAPADPAALAEGLQKCLQNGGFAQTMGQMGRRRVAETRDIARVALELQSLFRESIPATRIVTGSRRLGVHLNSVIQ